MNEQRMSHKTRLMATVQNNDPDAALGFLAAELAGALDEIDKLKEKVAGLDTRTRGSIRYGGGGRR